MNPNATIWIDRYSAEVARMLPAARRQDIEQEIRSLLLDELDASGSAATEANVLTLLRRYPSPQQMAARYGATQYLIGPALYPTFLQVLRLVLVIVTVVITINVIATLFSGNGATAVLEAIWNYLQALAFATGVVTIIFMLVERSGDATTHQATSDWNPATLPPAGEHNRVKVSDIISNVVTSLATILWLNLYVDSAGNLLVFSGGPTLTQVFTPLFLAFIPWLTVIWTSELLLSIVVLARGRWERMTRLLMIALLLVGTAATGLMLLLNPLGTTPQLERWIDGFVGVALIVTLVELAKQLWSLFRDRGQIRPVTMGSPAR